MNDRKSASVDQAKSMVKPAVSRGAAKGKRAKSWAVLSLAMVFSLVVAMGIVGCSSPEDSSSDAQDAGYLNVYSSRHYDIDREIFLQFEEETGIRVNVIEGTSHELLERLIREQGNPQADLFINVDSTALYEALSQDLLAPHNSEFVADQIEEGFFGDAWTALTLRARTALYDREQSSDIQINEYLDLASSEFADSVLVRSSTNTYNRALVAGLIQSFGEDYAEEFVRGIAGNMARNPEGNDRDQARAMIGGEGSIAIMSTYYVQNLLDSVEPFDVEVGERLVPVFPQETFTDITWAAPVAGSDQNENATKLIEFMIAQQQQEAIMNVNGEAPANKAVSLPPHLEFLYDYNSMQTNFEELGRYTIPAAMMMDIAGWE